MKTNWPAHRYLTPNSFSLTQRQVVEYEEEARLGGLRSHGVQTQDHSGAVGTHSLRSVQAWTKSELPPGQPLRELAPLFKKLDESVIDEEYARLSE